MGEMGQNTNTLVHAKKINFVLTALGGYRRVHHQAYILVKKKYPELGNRAKTKERQERCLECRL